MLADVHDFTRAGKVDTLEIGKTEKRGTAEVLFAFVGHQAEFAHLPVEVQ